MKKKLILTKKIKKTEEEKIDVGRRGDFVLVEVKRSQALTFGTLDNVVREDTHEGKQDLLMLQYPSYNLAFNEAYGVIYPIFRAKPQFQCLKRSSSYLPRNISQVITGLDNIITFLENHPDQRYKAHADLIRRIRDAQEGK